jgi:hypothetical protein
MKTCQRCKKTKKLDEFNKNRAESDGLQRYCRGCQKEAIKEWRKNNPERSKEHSKKTSRDFREKHPDYNKEYYRKKVETEEGKRYYRDRMNERNRRKREQD